MEVIDAIRNRRSIREFEKTDVSDELIEKILDAGRWAPSGNNNQPWRFVVVRQKETLGDLAGQTEYGDIIKNAPICIAVFLDKNSMYESTKDVLAIGACIQNMLLAAHSLNLGSVWLGEILKNKDIVARILKTPENYELMAVIAAGYPTKRERTSGRTPLEKLIYEAK